MVSFIDEIENVYVAVAAVRDKNGIVPARSLLASVWLQTPISENRLAVLTAKYIRFVIEDYLQLYPYTNVAELYRVYIELLPLDVIASVDFSVERAARCYSKK